MSAVPAGLRREAVVVVVQVLVRVHVLGLVLDKVLEEGQVFALDLSQRRRLLLRSVVVRIEVGNLDAELVLVRVRHLDVVLVGQQVPVVALEGAEAEGLSALCEVGVLVGVLGLCAGEVLVRVRVLVLAGCDRRVVLLLPLVRVVEVGLGRDVRVVVLVGVRVGVVVVVVLPGVVLGPAVGVGAASVAGGPVLISAWGYVYIYIYVWMDGWIYVPTHAAEAMPIRAEKKRADFAEYCMLLSLVKSVVRRWSKQWIDKARQRESV